MGHSFKSLGCDCYGWNEDDAGITPQCLNRDRCKETFKTSPLKISA